MLGIKSFKVLEIVIIIIIVICCDF